MQPSSTFKAWHIFVLITNSNLSQICAREGRMFVAIDYTHPSAVILASRIIVNFI